MDEFGEIYRTLFPQVYRYLLALCRDPELAEELTQETFFQGIQHIEAFRGECRCCFANKLRKIFIQSAKKKRRLKGF